MIEPCEEIKRLEQRYEKILDDEIKRVEQRYEKIIDDTEKYYKDVLDKIRAEILSIGKYESCKAQTYNLNKIRSEVAAINIYGHVDAHTMFIRTGEQVKRVVLEIIDKYRESEG